MNNQHSGWDKISEQEAKSTKKTTIKKNADTASSITSYIGWIILIIVIIVVVVVLFGTRGIDLIF